MRHMTKQLLAYLLIAAMLLPLLPFSASAEPGRDMSASDALWAQITALEDGAVSAKRDAHVTAADYAALSGEVAALVTGSEYYKAGTCTYDGENAFFFWETTDGEVCGYSPRLRSQMRSSGVAVPLPDAKRGGTTASADVAVFQPYYGIDSSFTTRYRNEGDTLAEATGGTATTYLTTQATVDAIADALETSGVVIFDSHGTTDYEKYMGYSDRYGYWVYDFSSQANTSYLCLQSGAGITEKDKTAATGTYGTYYHYFNGGNYAGMYYYCVDGTVIANHMDKEAPNSLLWMALCLGMATDGLFAPLREKGVEVVCGYSQSVTFDYDYKCEESFFAALRDGETVAEAAAGMKEAAGLWDDSATYRTIADARKYFAAFPVTVSGEDAYPGQGNVDDLQTVSSAWTLRTVYHLTVAANDETLGTVSLRDGVVTATPAEGAYVAGYTLTPEDAATVTHEGENVFRVENLTADCVLTVQFAAKTPATVRFSVPEGCEKPDAQGYVGDAIRLTPPDGAPTADGERYVFAGWTLTETDDTADAPAFFPDEFTPTDAETTLFALYTYEKDGVRYYTTVLRNCECYLARYIDTDLGAWYHEAVDFAVGSGLMNGVAANRFDPDGTLTRAMLVTILYRMSGETGGSHPFTDVPANEWYADAVAWAYTAGVVNGTDATRFSPGEPVTREQTAAMLYRYARYMGKDIAAAGNLGAFRDADRVSAYAITPMRWAVGLRILNGKGDALLDPAGTATRAEIAQILLNYFAAFPS